MLNYCSCISVEATMGQCFKLVYVASPDHDVERSNDWGFIVMLLISETYTAHACACMVAPEVSLQ